MTSRQTISSYIPAMSTTVTVLSVDASHLEHHKAMRLVGDELDAWEQRFSRFRPDSLLRRLNAADGKWVQVDEAFTSLLTSAARAVFKSAGRFDPAILPALEAAGYVSTIENVRSGATRLLIEADYPHGLAAWRLVDIDTRRRRVRLPAGMRIDLGGIAKGALADLLADRFMHWPGGAISIGGDMRVWGSPPDGSAWRVGIEDPNAPDTNLAMVELTDPSWRAIATSSTAKRQWSTESGSAHHLIDPFCSAPATTDVVAVTACASTAIAAEVTTKNIMIQSTTRQPGHDALIDSAWALLVSRSRNLTLVSKETS